MEKSDISKSKRCNMHVKQLLDILEKPTDAEIVFCDSSGQKLHLISITHKKVLCSYIATSTNNIIFELNFEHPDKIIPASCRS